MKHKIAAAAETCFRMTLLPMGFPTHVTNAGIILRNCPAIYGYPLSLSHCPHAYRERTWDNPRGAGHILPKPEGKQPGKTLGMAFEPAHPLVASMERHACSWRVTGYPGFSIGHREHLRSTVAEQLPETMTALAHFAVGGIEALAAQDNETVLEQMSSA
jgi:hypothetical protein